jgi:CubicO group peptidase (beta-lactamase class C family)
MNTRCNSNRRQTMKGLGLSLVVIIFVWMTGCSWIAEGPALPDPDYWPTQAWQTMTPEEGGFDSAIMADGLRAIRKNGTRIHSLMVIRHGRIVLDAYFYPYDGSTYHDMASVTKSVTTTLIGIAADQGLLELDQPMLSFFPDRSVAHRDSRKERITVSHLASMSSGLECSEAHDEETLHGMYATDDWVQYTLDLPMAWEPGTHFVYCGPGMHMLSAIIQQAGGMTALEFARANLFEPLGIHDVLWQVDPMGYNTGSGDLFLRPSDAAKLGFLWLHQGKWEDRQVVSRQWVRASTQRRMTETAGRAEDYGYGWWISNEEEDFPFVMATGVGGQTVRVFPDLDMVMVTTGSGFDMAEIAPYLIAAIGDFEEPLPPNPAGVADLKAAVAEIALAPEPSAPPVRPPIAREISGRLYVFEANPLSIRSIRLDFDESSEARVELDVEGEPEPLRLNVGLDGVYHTWPDENGLRSGAYGWWEGERTFVIRYSRVANLEDYDVRLEFDRDVVQFDLLEHVHGTTASLTGLAGKP